MRAKKLFSKRVKGVIVSTEIILILAAVVVLAFVAALGLGRNVMSQATSTKATILINNPQGWYFTGGTNSKNYIFVTFHVTNIGDKPVTITSVNVRLRSTTSCYYKQDSVSKTVNPGETISLTLKLDASSTWRCRSASIGKVETLIVTYQTADNRQGQIVQPIPMSTP